MAGEIKATDLIGGFDDLTKELKSFNDQLERTVNLAVEGKKAFDNTSKSQGDLAAKTNQVKKATSEVDKIEQERLKLLERLKQANSDRIQTNEEIKVQLQKQNKTNKELAKEKLGLIGAYEKESKRLIKLRKEYKDLAAGGKENTKRAKELRNEIGKLDTKLKGIDKTVGQHQRNVGNYGDALNALPGRFGAVVNGIKMMSKALLATPLGWLIGLIAGAGAALKTFFVNSEEGQDRWNKITAKGRVILGNFKDGLAEAGKNLLDFTKNIKESEGGVKGFFKSIGDNLKTGWKQFKEDVADKGVWNTIKDNATDAFNEVKENIKGVIDENKREIAIATQLAELENQLNKRERKNLVETAKLRRDIAELRAKAADKENTTALQRIQLIDEAIAKQNEILQLEEDTLSKRVYIAKEQAKLSGSTREDLEEIAQLETKLIDLQTTNAERRRRFTAEQQTAIREQAAEIDSFISEIEKQNEEFEASLIDGSEDVTKKIEDDEKRKLEAALERIEKVKEAEQELYEFGVNTVNQLFELRSSFREQEIGNLEMQKEAEIALAEESGKDTAAIEAKFAKKEADLRKKQAIQDKLQALFNAGITIAEGILKYSSNPVTAPLVPAFIALGAVQLGAIAATPIPQFFKGVEGFEGGMAIVGEKGREIIDMPGYAPMLSPGTNTMMYLPRGTDVIPNPQTEQILKEKDSREFKVLKSIDKKLSGKGSVVNYSWSKDALIKLEDEGRKRTKYLGRRVNRL